MESLYELNIEKMCKNALAKWTSVPSWRKKGYDTTRYLRSTDPDSDWVKGFVRYLVNLRRGILDDAIADFGRHPKDAVWTMKVFQTTCDNPPFVALVNARYMTFLDADFGAEEQRDPEHYEDRPHVYSTVPRP